MTLYNVLTSFFLPWFIFPLFFKSFSVRWFLDQVLPVGQRSAPRPTRPHVDHTKRNDSTRSLRWLASTASVASERYVYLLLPSLFSRAAPLFSSSPPFFLFPILLLEKYRLLYNRCLRESLNNCWMTLLHVCQRAQHHVVQHTHVEKDNHTRASLS